MRTVSRIFIPSQAVDHTLDVMRHFGSYGYEALVLWIGEHDDTRAVIRRVFVPEQTPLASEKGVGYFVERDALFELNRDLAATGLRLIAQVHSHPGRAYHSEADDRYAIVTQQGGVSLVVPDFGAGQRSIARWAAYRLGPWGWRPIPPHLSRTLLQVV